ncbi:MAG: FadR family transcriptional regulator [Anaerolineaceae bacterium]|nr:FadR family transcriptional regulator [Anaerolineaceae bacterium]
MDSNLKLVPPQKITVVESIIEQIVTKIRDGELNPDDKLPSERKLIEMLGVSRSSVREALQGLAAMGLVETRSGEGTFVKKRRPQFDLYESNIEVLSDTLQKEMRLDMNQARLILERGIVTQAAENINEESVDSIRTAWQELNTFEDKTISDPSHMNWEIHDKFHISIAEASGNPFLASLLKTLMESIPELLRDKNLIYGDAETSRRVFKANRIIHMELCKAVIDGNAPMARHWVQQHSDYEKMNILESYGVDVAENRRNFEEKLHNLKGESHIE